MRCPYCGQDDDRVIDSRSAEASAAIRRRRECLRCARRFTTYERVERTQRLVVVKKGGARVPFNRENILRGIQAACGKRPIPEDRKVAIAVEVEELLHREHEREVSSLEIGRLVASRLREIDEISYLRFSSEHEAFGSLEDLAAAVRRLQERRRDHPNQAPLFE